MVHGMDDRVKPAYWRIFAQKKVLYNVRDAQKSPAGAGHGHTGLSILLPLGKVVRPVRRNDRMAIGSEREPLNISHHQVWADTFCPIRATCLLSHYPGKRILSEATYVSPLAHVFYCMVGRLSCCRGCQEITSFLNHAIDILCLFIETE